MSVALIFFPALKCVALWYFEHLKNAALILTSQTVNWGIMWRCYCNTWLSVALLHVPYTYKKQSYKGVLIVNAVFRIAVFKVMKWHNEHVVKRVLIACEKVLSMNDHFWLRQDRIRSRIFMFLHRHVFQNHLKPNTLNQNSIMKIFSFLKIEIFEKLWKWNRHYVALSVK